MSKKRNLLVLFAVWLALANVALAQTDPNVFYLPVAVTGAKNAYVKGMSKDSFRLFEDGKEQTIDSFIAEDQPLDINIILALGQLQRGRSDLNSSKIREALESFKQQGNVKNKYNVEEMPFGANGIFDSISRHITYLTEKSTNPRRVLLVLTDTFEASAGDPGRALQEYAKKLKVPVYIVFAAANNAAGAPADIQEVGRGNQIYLSGGAIYDDIAKFTGGRMYQAEADTQLRSQLESLAQELKAQYVLGYKSTNPNKDDKWRKLEVRVKPPADATDVKQELKPKVRDRYFVAKVK